MNDYELKKQAKINYYKEKAAKLDKESDVLYNNAKELGSILPFGQPILVGHHSENRHRNLLKRINQKYDKAFETMDKAKYYEQKAETVENNNSISSDDPEAITKIKEKMQSITNNIEYSKRLNALLRKYKTRSNALIEIPKLSDENPDKSTLLKMVENHYYACPPDRIAAYYFSTTNHNAELTRLKDRLLQLENKSKQKTQETTINGIKIIDNVEENRIQVFFDGKPAEEIRNTLKRSGFRWTPSKNCWQSYRKQYCLDAAKKLQEGTK
jgi:hypothetical protein